MEKGIAFRCINCCADLLEQHRKIHFVSAGLTLSVSVLVLTLAALSLLSPMLLISMFVIIILGILETIYAVRVGFDARLLGKLSESSDQLEDQLDVLDTALKHLRLLPAEKPRANLDERLLGCIGLFRVQSIMSSLQFLSLLLAVVLQAV